MRSARLIVLGAAVAGVVVLAVLAVSQRTSLAFTLGVIRSSPVVPLDHGQRVCQRPIDVPADTAFDRVALSVGTFRRAGSPLEVSVADERGRVVGRGRFPAATATSAASPCTTFVWTARSTPRASRSA